MKRLLKFLKMIFTLAFIFIAIIAAYFTFQGYTMYKEAITECSIEEKVKEIKEEKENFTTIDKLPKDYINAVIAVEDHRFYIHNGVDYISIVRAIVTNIKSKELVEGGSSITQQLAKNTYFTQKKEITRKIAEAFVARDYEKTLTKDEIFELYVNTSYFGHGYYCIYDASKGYFDKEPIDMNLYESTLMAGVPNAPSVYAPTKNPDLAMQRQAQVLRKMIKYGYLTEEQKNEISNISYDSIYNK